MFYEAIDTLFVAVADSDATAAAYERLGLKLSQGSLAGPTGRSFTVGPSPSTVTVELLAGQQYGGGDHPLVEPVQRAQDANRGLFAVGLRVADVGAVVRQLAERGVDARLTQLKDAAGVVVADLAYLPLHDRAAADLVLIQHHGPRQNLVQAGSFTLQRLDHLAAVAHDLDFKTRFWTDVLGVPQTGEVTTPTMVIRQFRIGDAVMELLGAASADSPIHQRPPGLVSMASWQVADLARAVQHARRAGFTVSDPSKGALPGTRIATIPGVELGGMNMQLLEYVAGRPEHVIN